MNIKYYISLVVLMFSISLPAKAMELHYFDKDIVELLNDASLALLSYTGRIVLLFLILGGVYYIISGADPQKQEYARKTISYSLLGLILILVSYGVINKTSEIGTGVSVMSLPTCYWDCTDWSVCVAGNQTRVCTESCGAVVGSPIVTRGCIVPPVSFDWSHVVLPAADPVGGANWMTPVKDQGACGSCWAFATLGYVEAIYNIEQSSAVLDRDLSEQGLMSCSSAGSCSGGSPVLAVEHIKNTGVVPQTCFAYSASNETCTVPNRCATWATQLWKVGKWFVSSTSSQASIKNELVNYGPVSAAMNMSTWNSATEDCSSSSEDHAVVIVGYDDIGGYWIVRNSWGAGWIDGIGGYFRVKYGECGLDSGITVGVEGVTSP